MSASLPRLVFLGAGAIGAGIGGLMWEAGADVLLVARGAHGAALAKTGLDLRLPGGSKRLRVPVGGAAEVRPDDLVVLATMGHDTETALAGVPPECIVVTFQNGLRPLELLEGRTAIAGMLYVPAERRAPGVVALAGTPEHGAVFLGTLTGGPFGFVAQLVDTLREAGFRAEWMEPIRPWLHAKLLTNLGGTFAALCDDAPVALIEATVDEARACFAAARLDVVPDEAFDTRVGPMVLAAVDGLPRIGGSTRHALARGDRLETRALHEPVVELGRRLGVPTPLNAALIVLAEEAEANRWRPGCLTPAEIERRLRG